MTHRFDPEQLRAERLAGVCALRDSEAFFSNARFSEALEVVRSVRQLAFHPAHSDAWQARLLAEEARLRYHMRDLAGMQVCLAQIELQQRAMDALLDATCFQIEGLQARVRAVEARSIGDRATARESMQKAITSFGYAATAGSMAADSGLAMWNSRINIAYCKGFLAALDGRSHQANRQLVAVAIAAEHEIQLATPSGRYTPFPGIVMIADLALGASLSVADVFDLDEGRQIPDLRTPYTSSCQRVLGTREREWIDVLLDSVRNHVEFNARVDSNLKPWQLAQALIFAVKLVGLLEDGDARVRRGRALIPHIEFAKQRCLHVRTLRDGLEAASARLAQRTGLQSIGRRILR